MTAEIVSLASHRKPARPRLVREGTTPAEDLAYALGKALRADDLFEDMRPCDSEPPETAA